MAELEEMMHKQVEDEFKGVLKYDELIEKMPKEHTKHIVILRNIQKDQAVHTLELVNMAMDMGFREPPIVQQLEDFFKIKEY